MTDVGPGAVRVFEIRPHAGVGPVLLGMTRAEVHAALGPPDRTTRDNRESFLGGFFVDFAPDGRVELIELAVSPHFRAVFNGVWLHGIVAEDAVGVVSRHARYDETNPELGYTYVFRDLDMSLWRGTLPETGQAADDDDGRYFEAVAIGITGYFSPST
jgi:hypothetical protein